MMQAMPEGREDRSRWTDSAKVQIALLMGVIAFGIMTFAAGYATYNFRNTVAESPNINAAQWEAINANTRSLSAVITKLDEVIVVVNDTRCYVRARTDAERDACTEESNRPVQPTPTRGDP